MVHDDSVPHGGARDSLWGPTGAHEGVRRLIGPTVRWVAAQHRAVLRQALGPDANRVMPTVAAATLNIEATVARRVEARLPEILRDEVRRLFEDALSGSESPSARLLAGSEKTAEGGLSVGRGGEDDEEPGLSAHETGRPEEPQGDRSDWEGWNRGDHLNEALVPAFEAISVGNADSSRSKALAGGENDRDAPESSDHELYEGTVTLALEPMKAIGQVVEFIRALCLHPEIRLAKMSSTPKDGVAIWLALRQPVRLEEILPTIEGVSGITTSADTAETGQHRTLTVQLK